MGYSVKEIYYTLQGEGANTGRSAVFCRFSGCNLWSGREEDRAGAICKFCDTNFWGIDGPSGGSFVTPQALVEVVQAHWPSEKRSNRFVVCTGGEPLLQLDGDLVGAFHEKGFAVAVETNGTKAVPPGLDWICMSPKAGTEIILKSGQELKLVYPQLGAEPELFAGFEFEHFYLQPMDGPEREKNTRLTMEYCLNHPEWKLSLQTHKMLRIP
jgi:7-carboxy-7-deazaguanine synthase (Cx14CxxC type)